MKNPIYTSDPQALAIFRRAFPATNPRTVTLSEFTGPRSLASFWDAGNRDYFAIVRISDGETLASLPQNGTPFDANAFELSALPEGYTLAVWSRSGGREFYRLELNRANLTPLLPAGGPAAAWIETAVLACVCSLKSAFRREQAARLGISAAEFDATIAILKSKGLLTANGGASNDGRNADTLARGASIQWNWSKLADAGDRDSEEKQAGERMRALYGSAA